MKSCFKIIALFFYLGSLSLNTSAFGGECLKMGGFVQNEKAFEFVLSRVKKAFTKAHLCFEKVIMPARRISNEIKKGNLDGEFVRNKAYVQGMKDYVVLVPTPLFVTEGYLVTLADGDFKPRTLADVKDESIGVISGVKWHELLVHKIKNPHRRNRMTNLISLLKARRIDGFLAGGKALQRVFILGYAMPHELHKSAPLVKMHGHIILHKKHIKLVDRLNKALTEITFASK